MFYVKANGKRTAIEYDNVFTYCPICGRKHYVDLSEILATGGDLYGTSVYCPDCAENRIAARRNNTNMN